MNRTFSLAIILVSISLFSGCGQKANKAQETMSALDNLMQESQGTTSEESSLNLQAQVPPSQIPQANPNAASRAASPTMPVQAVSVNPNVSEKPTSEQIQQALKNAGLYSGDIDGKIGPKSKKAIMNFQQQNGLNADGKVGAKTWERLGAYLNAAAQSASQAPTN